jgi:hypothetical protein
MGDRRQVHRREPIELVMDDGRVFTARPLPWLARNDLGSAIVQHSLNDLNEAVRLFVDPKTSAPQLALDFDEKLKNPLPILLMMYPEEDEHAYDNLDRGEITALLVAGVEVNDLERIRHLVDPNFQPPLPNGGTSSSGVGTVEEITTGLKTVSSLDSSLPESDAATSSN